jgi:phosphoglycolate phosphatase
MRFQHIIWDWNGTLLDDTQAGVNAINAMLAARGLPQIDVPYYREVFGFPVINFYRTIGFPVERENWDAVAREFHDRFLADTSIRLHAHARKALAGFRQAGVKQSILSASEQNILDDMLSLYGIADYFDCAWGVDNLYGQSKLQLGRTLIDKLALDPAALLLVGDSLHDHEVARDLGVRCLLIAQGHQSRARLARSGAPVLDSLADVPAWLKERPTR